MANFAPNIVHYSSNIPHHTRIKEYTIMDNEKRIDFDFLLGKGIADYSDGDIIIIEKIGAKPIEENVKLDMIMMLFCIQGRVQGDINGKTYMAQAGDVIITLPNSYLCNYLMSPDFESKIIGISYSAARRNTQTTRDIIDLLEYIAKNPVVHLDTKRQVLMSQYYSIIAHKINHPHGYFHKEIMHGIFQCAFYELCALISPHVQYADNGGSIKQANLQFKKFIEMLSNNEGKMHSVKFYAEKLCITPKYLSFISKTVSGKTALYWIHDFTIKTIVRYLKHSNLSIKEISDMLEFPNLSFFGKFTKNHLGVSPTEFRRKQSIKAKA